jgi:hypothetical protein
MAAALLLLPPAAAPAAAQDSAACRRSCNAQHAERARNPREVQACLIRCAAGERHSRRQNQRGTAEATGRGQPVPSGVAAGAAGVAGAAALGAGAAAAARPAPGQQQVLVAYSGRMPSRSVAVSAPGMGREEAHRMAESACVQGNGGRACLLLGETTERCAAVAEGRRSMGVIATNDPSTTVVLHHSLGTGPDARRAEFEALSTCGTRMVGPSVGCRIVAQRCN